MSSLNKVQLIGNLGKDPEVRYTGSGQAVANFTIATSVAWKDKKTGEKQERTEWHRITVWGKLGELCGEYLAKGRKAYVEGHLQTREWTDKDKVKRYVTEVVADEVLFLDSAPKTATTRPARSVADDFGPPPPGFDDEAPANTGSGRGPSEDDIPF